MMLRYVKKIEAQAQKWFSYQKKNCKEKNNKNRFGKYCLMTGGRILVSLKDSRPLLYKCSFNGYHNAGCGYYILFIIFGIITFIGCCRVWVLYISLVKVFIWISFFSQRKL